MIYNDLYNVLRRKYAWLSPVARQTCKIEKNRQTLINRDILTVRDSYKKILKNLCCFLDKKQLDFS